MKRSIACICVIIVVTSCVLNNSGKSSKNGQGYTNPFSNNNGVTVFFTGNIHGSLKPCGCSGGQLGGLDRRPAVFNSMPQQKRLLIDTGSIVETDSEQDLIKFSIIMQAFNMIEYDLVNLTREDIEIAESVGMLGDSEVNFISAFGAEEEFAQRYQNEFLLNGEHIIVSVVTLDLESRPIEFIREAFPQKTDKKNVNILIINKNDNSIISSISEMDIIDCLICPPEYDEPIIISDPDSKLLAFSVGKNGRYICLLQINTIPNEDNLNLSFNYIPVSEDIKQDIDLKNLYKDYQQTVKAFNLLERNKPNYPLPDGLRYTGSESCESADCHDDPYKHQWEYVTWLGNAHAQAYATLEKVGSQYDPECIVCHVIGYDYESGYISEEKTPHLKNVGCEYCHGPGSKHNENPYEYPTTPIPDTIELCKKCHTPEHHGDFAGNEEEKLKIINHWPEPNEVSNVK
jgi:hypothetical protein